MREEFAPKDADLPAGASAGIWPIATNVAINRNATSRVFYLSSNLVVTIGSD